MTDAPKRIWLHKMPTGIMQANYAISDTHDSSGQVEYIRVDLVDAQDAAWCERVAALEAAVAAARVEGVLKAAKIAAQFADHKRNVPSDDCVDLLTACDIEYAILMAAEASK